jgi:ABC-type transport system involved in cytochrome c biogenesis permease subunit
MEEENKFLPVGTDRKQFLFSKMLNKKNFHKYDVCRRFCGHFSPRSGSQLMNIFQLENFFANSSFSFLFLSMVAYWVQIAFHVKKWNIGRISMFIANFCLLTLLILRWKESGHFPLSNLYESLMFLAWSLSTFHFILENIESGTTPNSEQIQKGNKRFFVGAFTSPTALFINAFATFRLPLEMQQSSPLVPALQSNWLMMHVTVMILSYSALICGSLLSIAFLIFTKNLQFNLNNEKKAEKENMQDSSLVPSQTSFSSSLLRQDTHPPGRNHLRLSIHPSIRPRSGKVEKRKSGEAEKWTGQSPGGCKGGLDKVLAGSLNYVEAEKADEYTGQSDELRSSSQLGPTLAFYTDSKSADESLGIGMNIVQTETMKTDGLSLVAPLQQSQVQMKQKFAENLDNLSYRILGIGFPLLTIGILSGAVWANEAWGSYWSWDPKETWALATWLVFAIYLHLRISKGWRGKKPAILASLGFVTVWVCFLGVNLLGEGLHSYGFLKDSF